MKTKGQKYLEKISKKNKNRERLPRGIYAEKNITSHDSKH